MLLLGARICCDGKGQLVSEDNEMIVIVDHWYNRPYATKMTYSA